MAKYHPNKEINKAIEYALEKGWRFEKGGSHCYGFLNCPHTQRGGCCPGVQSTPKSPRDHAKDLIRKINKCPHQG